jgi:4-alpha-glucanotransferase
MNFKRSHGLLLHPTSLPSMEGVGTLGAESRAFVHWLSTSGASAWQMLPLVPVGAGFSPYSSPSAFAGNPLLISIIDLKEEGWVDKDDFDLFQSHVQKWGLDQVNYEALSVLKSELLFKSAERFLNAKGDHHKELEHFTQTHHHWLDHAALFQVIAQEEYQGQPWWTWAPEVRDRAPNTLVSLAKKYERSIRKYKVIQFWFQQQWDRVRTLADTLHISLIGDVPIYVDHHSADVWCHRELFELDDHGQPFSVAGVPPDAFSETGQLWGNPIYNWHQHLNSGYQWWIERLRRALSLTHTVRIDHFRAFAAYWSIPYGSENATQGTWIKGPGLSLFDQLKTALDPDNQGLPLIAEDLGLIDQPVINLLEATKLPGMKVLQFAFDGDPNNTYLPHNFTSPHCIIYTGTHDNETTKGWWISGDERIKHRVRTYCAINGDAEQICWDMVRLAHASIATLAIIPLQDLLALGNNARMNQPSLPSGNWSWRVRHEALNSDISERLRSIATLFGRCIKHDPKG